MLFFLDQHGCAKNQVDGELIIGYLRERGWERTDDPDAADLIVVNSCGFIESAKKESLDAALTAHAAHPRAKVLLAGCLAERYADDLAEGLPEVAGFFGNGDLSKIGDFVAGLFPDAPKAGGADPATSPVLVSPQEGVCVGERPEILSFPRSVYVKITEGCDNWCSFCAIPLIRGRLRSRSVAEIVGECRDLVGRGYYELNFIGQDLAAFGTGDGDSVDGEPVADRLVDANAPGSRSSAGGEAAENGSAPAPSPLSRLLRGISALEGDFRVRLLYIHPDHFPRDILPVMAADPRFLPYFDIPFQSGDGKILAAMNRRGDAESYKRLVEDIRAAFAAPGNPYGTVALRTTILSGFPGETDESFEATARFLADIRPMWSGSFAWSEEEGTKAADMKKRPTKKAVKVRLDTLLEIQRRITPERLSFFMGKTVDVLVEELIPVSEESRDGADVDIPESRLALGRAWFQAPEVDGSVVLQFEDNQADSAGKPIGPGSVVSAVVMNVNGVDVEAVVR